MSKKDQDAPYGIGGCYEVGRDGVRRQVSPGTADHPEGNRPRDKDGKVIYDTEQGRPDAPSAPAAAPATVQTE